MFVRLCRCPLVLEIDSTTWPAPTADLAPRVPIMIQKCKHRRPRKLGFSPNLCRYEECVGAIPSREQFPDLSMRLSSRRLRGGKECFVHLSRLRRGGKADA